MAPVRLELHDLFRSTAITSSEISELHGLFLDALQVEAAARRTIGSDSKPLQPRPSKVVAGGTYGVRSARRSLDLLGSISVIGNHASFVLTQSKRGNRGGRIGRGLLCTDSAIGDVRLGHHIQTALKAIFDTPVRADDHPEAVQRQGSGKQVVGGVDALAGCFAAPFDVAGGRQTGSVMGVLRPVYVGRDADCAGFYPAKISVDGRG